jgi:hypothetical protein
MTLHYRHAWTKYGIVHAAVTANGGRTETLQRQREVAERAKSKLTEYSDYWQALVREL